MVRLFAILIIGTFIFGLFSCSQKNLEYPPSNPYREVILDSLAHPWSMVFFNDQEAFISEKDGDLLRVDLETRKRYPIKGFPEDLYSPVLINVSEYPARLYPLSMDGKQIYGNAGILDVVLHPGFEENNRIFISYVSQIEKTFALKIISARVVEDSLIDIQTILNPGPYVPGIWHFGGGLCISGNHLYITVGERLFFEDFKSGLPIAQDVTDARGAIYRLNLDGSIPKDNPDLGSNSVPGMYAFGIRAAQGITSRPGTDEIWFSEHGTNQGDEINLLQSGANYGWPNISTGTWRSPGYIPDSLMNPNYVDPQHFWLQTVAPTGLIFYSGSEFPAWQGNIIVAGLSRGSLWRLVLDDKTIVSAEELFLGDHIRSRKVVQGPDGQLYQLTDEDNGKLIRIINKK